MFHLLRAPLFRYSLFFPLLLALPHVSTAQNLPGNNDTLQLWRSTSLPVQPRIESLTIAASGELVIYIDGNGSFISPDTGKTWIPWRTDSGKGMFQISYNPSTACYFALTDPFAPPTQGSSPKGSYRLIRSCDHGETWQEITLPKPLVRNSRLVVNKTSGEIIVADEPYITTPGLLIKSTDNGSTWNTIRGKYSDGKEFNIDSAFSWYDFNDATGTLVFMTSADRIVRVDTRTGEAADVTPDTTLTYYPMWYRHNGGFYTLGLRNSRISYLFYSGDDGKSWRKVYDSVVYSPDNVLGMSASGTPIMVTQARPFTSINRGRTWEPYFRRFPYLIRSIVPMPNSTWLAASNSGIYRITADGTIISDHTSTLWAGPVDFLHPTQKGEIVAMATGAPLGDYSLFDAGTALWKRHADPITPTATVRQVAYMNDFIWLMNVWNVDSTIVPPLRTPASEYALYITKDRGEKWKRVYLNDSTPFNVYVNRFMILNDSTCYIQTSQNTYVTVDTGKTWKDLDTIGIPGVSGIVARPEGGILRTITRIISNRSYFELELVDTVLQKIATHTSKAYEGSGYYKIFPLSQNDYIGWQYDQSGPLLDRITINGSSITREALAEPEDVFDIRKEHAADVAMTATGILYVVTDKSIYRSDDTGKSFRAFNRGLPDQVRLNRLAITPDDNVYLGTTAYGVFTLQTDVAGSVHHGWEPQWEVSIAPTPVTESAVIYFSLDHDQELTIELFDLHGSPVGNLTAAGTLYRAGTHSLAWSAGGISPGVYIMRISGEGRTQSLQVVVL